MTLRNAIFRNFWLKLFSVASGSIIWMAIHYSIEHDIALTELAPDQSFVKKDFLVPVLIMAQDRNSILSRVSNTGTNRAYKVTPTDVLITVFGPPTALDATAQERIKVFVDLTDFHSRTPLREDLHADVPHDVYVQELKPGAVTVEPSKP